MTPTSLSETRVWRSARSLLASWKLIVARFAVLSLPVSVGTADAQVLLDHSGSYIVQLVRLPTIAAVNVTPEADCTELPELASAVEPDTETGCARSGRANVQQQHRSDGQNRRPNLSGTSA
jgi:hypothetical protein